MISYDDRQFSPESEHGGPAPVAHYHQSGDLLWGEFRGAEVRRGTLVGTVTSGGELHFGYSMVLADDTVVTGLCHSLPTVLPDGRIRLTEHWERFGAQADSGISALLELPRND